MRRSVPDSRNETVSFYQLCDEIAPFCVEVTCDDHPITGNMINRVCKGSPDRREFLVFGAAPELVKWIAMHRASPQGVSGECDLYDEHSLVPANPRPFAVIALKIRVRQPCTA